MSFTKAWRGGPPAPARRRASARARVALESLEGRALLSQMMPPMTGPGRSVMAGPVMIPMAPAVPMSTPMMGPAVFANPMFPILPMSPASRTALVSPMDPFRRMAPMTGRSGGAMTAPVMGPISPEVPVKPVVPVSPASTMAGQAMHSPRGLPGHSGLVRKAPHFYEFFVGPQRADLNLVSASARLVSRGALAFTGMVQGPIARHPATPAGDTFFVFGVNRGSPRAVAPFFDRPGVVFDSVVVVSITQESGISAKVTDLATGASTTLPPSSVRVSGRQVSVVVNPALLPTPPGGVPLAQYTFNLWTRTSLSDPTPTPSQPHPSTVASFIPEDAMAPIAVPRGGLG
jgi:hypothetical protein